MVVLLTPNYLNILQGNHFKWSPPKQGPLYYCDNDMESNLIVDKDSVLLLVLAGAHAAFFN
jgi:hypothetical protein